ncbi:hypothetical protein IWX49DRAFT_552375 [Phyllosticta citricarpa]|uniref:Uncharacterized protein n=1 Tax=Phyllosticta citricarpa TaxID=55181 RepID=A0ABR1MJJ0_9PEZI
MPPPTLLSLPREIRDQIWDLCLTTPLPPACPTEKYTAQPAPSTIFVNSFGSKKWQPLFNFPPNPRTNGGGLRLTCRQIGGETCDALNRLNAHGRLRYVVRLRIEEEEGDATGERERYWVDWVILPTRNWLAESRPAKAGVEEGKKSLANLESQEDERAQLPVNLVVQVEKTMRAKPSSPEHHDHQNPDQQQQQNYQRQQQRHDDDQEPPGPDHLSALYRRYHFLCRPELRPPLPRPLTVERSLLRVAERGVLLLHWALADMVARIVTEGPCCLGRGIPIPAVPPSPLSTPSSSSSFFSLQPHPRPFTLTLHCPYSSPSPHGQTQTQTQTQTLTTPLLEFLPFYLHSAKLSYSPFRNLVAGGLLRRFDFDFDFDFDSGVSERGRERGTRPQGQAKCPVPATSCCVQGTGAKGEPEEDEEAHLHWVCDVVKRVGEEEERARQSERQVERDYDDDW